LIPEAEVRQWEREDAERQIQDLRAELAELKKHAQAPSRREPQKPWLAVDRLVLARAILHALPADERRARQLLAAFIGDALEKLGDSASPNTIRAHATELQQSLVEAARYWPRRDR
jgi:hypothetical protein